MKNTCVCEHEVTPSMVRQGAVLTRGGRYVCRTCPEASRSPGLDTVDAETDSGIRVAQYASFGRRVLAHVIDSLILNVFVILSGSVFGLGAGMLGIVEPSLTSIVGGTLGAIIPLGYCVWFWTKKGATPGKLMLGIRVMANGNQPLTTGQSIVRYIGYIPSALVLGLGYLWMLWDDESRCWHDRMAGTYVIRV